MWRGYPDAYYYCRERIRGEEWMEFTDTPPAPRNERVRHQFVARVKRRVIGYIHNH